jgi:predicted ABC-type exoprotein transport system permease subunit
MSIAREHSTPCVTQGYRKEKKLVMKLITGAHAMFTIMLNLAFVAC